MRRPETRPLDDGEYFRYVRGRDTDTVHLVRWPIEQIDLSDPYLDPHRALAAETIFTEPVITECSRPTRPYDEHDHFWIESFDPANVCARCRERVARCDEESLQHAAKGLP